MTGPYRAFRRRGEVDNSDMIDCGGFNHSNAIFARIFQTMSYPEIRFSSAAFLAAAAGTLLCTLVGIQDAQAMSCWTPTPAEHIQQTGMVFYGQAMTGADGPKDDKERVVEFKVIRAYKGVRGDTVRIKYHNDHGALMGWGFGNNQATLVFADRISAADAKKETGQVGYCTMIPYHARSALHSIYWDVLAPMKP